MAGRKQFYPKRDENDTIDFSSIADSMPWPKKGTKLFVDVSQEPDSQTRMIVSWVETFKDTGFLGDAFKDASDQLIEAVIEGADGSHPDRFLYPALYLYRHGLELKLKHLLDQCSELECIKEHRKYDEVVQEHSLYPLWNVLKDALREAQPNTGDEFIAVESMINELHQVDRSGQNLRYAEGQNGQQIELKLPDAIDMARLRTAMNDLWGFLDACESMLCHYIDLKQDFEREMASYADSEGY